MEKIFQLVSKRIKNEYKKTNKLSNKDSKNIILNELNNNKYIDVYEVYIAYQNNIIKSRESFLNKNKMHKFLKIIEGIGLKSAYEENSKRENANVDGNTAMGTMLQYGSIISKEFTKSYLIKNEFVEAHENGDIHIHDIDFIPMGTTTCCQINLNKLFSNGFSTGHGFIREPNDIMSYTALAAIAIQSNQNDQHGGQVIPAFDYYLAPGVLKHLKNNLNK